MSKEARENMCGSMKIWPHFKFYSSHSCCASSKKKRLASMVVPFCWTWERRGRGVHTTECLKTCKDCETCSWQEHGRRTVGIWVHVTRWKTFQLPVVSIWKRAGAWYRRKIHRDNDRMVSDGWEVNSTHHKVTVKAGRVAFEVRREVNQKEDGAGYAVGSERDESS